MKKRFDNYEHLAGGTLWEGPDHLLFIERTGWPLAFTESYRRVDYAKIQAISYARTRWFIFLLILLMVLLALVSWALWALRDTTPGLVIFGALTAVVAVMTVVHLARGPTCICKIQTAVQVLHLRSLNRLRPTLRCVARLTQLCLQHQGGQALSPEVLAAAEASPLAVSSAAATSGFIRGPKPPYPGSLLVKIGLPLLLVGGLMMLAEPFIQHLGFFFASGLVGGAADILVLLALAWMSRYTLPPSLKISLWGAMVNVILSFVAGYALLMKSTFTTMQSTLRGVRGKSIDANMDFWRWMSDATLADMGWIGWLWMACGAFAILFAIIGLPAGFFGASTAGPAAPPPLAPPPAPPEVPAAP